MAIRKLDDFISNFTFPRRATIYSKRLRVPELIVEAFLIFGLLGYQIIYKLNFLVEQPIEVGLNLILWSPEADYWDCDSDERYDLPPLNQSYCSRKHRECRFFDNRDDIKATGKSLMLSTNILSHLEINTSKGWQPAKDDQDDGHNVFTVGAEQMVNLEGHLPSFSGSKKLADMQGFIKYRNESKPRRIRCTPDDCYERKSAGQPWIRDCQHYPGSQFWSGLYPSQSGNGNVPNFTYSETGCFAGSDWVSCHISELLHAAGIDLDADPQKREDGAFLKLILRISNADVGDFWHLPIGFKPKYVIEIEHLAGNAQYPMYITYDSRSTKENQRYVSEHYGILIDQKAVLHWTKFDPFQLAGILVLAFSALTYAKIIVTNVLVMAYKRLGCARVSILYEYNARKVAATGEQAETSETASDLMRFQQLADETHLDELLQTDKRV